METKKEFIERDKGESERNEREIETKMKEIK